MSSVRAPLSGSGLRSSASALALLWLLLLTSCAVDKQVSPVQSGDGGKPEDPWAVPLSFTVDETLRPSADAVAQLDGKDRRVEALASPDGETMQLLVDELLVGTVDDAVIAPLLERRGGQVLWKVGGGSPTEPGFTLVHIEPGPADAEGVASLLREMGDEGVGLEGGEQRVSHPDVIGLLATLLEESSMLDVPVSPNIVMSLATVGTGTTVEADDVGSSALTRDACSWPHMKSGGMQDIGVCDAWRLLLQLGRMDTRVDVGVIDQGFAATPDTMQGSEFHVPGMDYAGGAFWQGPPNRTGCASSGGAGGDCKWHGTWTSSALGAVPDNAWGSAGPGGLNARLQHIDPVALLESAIRDRLGSGALTLDQLQAGLVAATTQRLPPRSVAFVGVATHIPWPFSLLVEHAMDPVFQGVRDAGILVFAPAGHALDVDQVHLAGPKKTSGWETALSFPCELAGVVCVGGLARDSNRRDAQSAHGSPRPAAFVPKYELGTVDIYGPGTVAVGPDPSDELSETTSLLRERRGTSLAAAFTAGVAAEVWAADPSLSPAAVEQILLDTMHHGSPSPEVIGWVDAYAAVEGAGCPAPTTHYRDADGDGFGDPSTTEQSCLASEGYIAEAGDCDDTDDGIFPGAEERCDGVDQNCDPSDEQGLACDDGKFCTRTDACNDRGECKGKSSPCASDERCDEDADECVSTGCSDDADCDDGKYCNGDETCDDKTGDCKDGSRELDDDVACTDDSCNEDKDEVEHAPDDGSCDDGVFCNGEETCDADQGCQAGTDPCPDNVCDEANEQCVPCTQDADCNDSLYCNGEETCNTDTGNCIAGTAPASSDSVDCTVDTCVEATDSIVHTPSNALCDDALFCNGAETCDATLGCQAGAAPVVPDAFDCTFDSCNEQTDRVVHTPSNATCDDGVYCNGAETCSVTLGCQAGAAPVVPDSVSCTTDTCNEQTDTVEHTPSNAACDDGLYCNGAESCNVTLGCRPGTAPTLSDSVACTTDSCNEATDSVQHVPNNGACSDGQYCNGAETCSATLGCRPGNAPCVASICDEQLNVCDICIGDQDCDDGRYCNGVETCYLATGECLSGVAPSMDDGVDCTVDSCNENTDAAVHTPNDAACSDGLYCNGTETCDDLLDCRPGTPRSPADAVACTLDSCDEATDSFVHTPVNSACTDALYCDGTETCNVTLGCQSSGNPCSAGHCNDTLDACVACLVDGHCADGLFCNGAEVCNVGAGTCGPGIVAGLDDGIPCTTDSCNEANDSVGHTPVNAACNDGLYCDGVETCSATLGCQDGANPCVGGCTEANDTCFACNQDSDCNDGLYCNGTETCNLQVGQCVAGTGPTLTDGVPCTVDSCNEATDSVDHTPSNAMCSNGAFCDGAETCSATLGCQAGTPPTLSDGVGCTTDACSEATDTITHTPNAAACSDGLFCDGAEVCHPVNDCQPGTPPVLNDGLACTTDACVEATDSITHTPNDGACDNGLFCDGTETCSAVNGCQSGTPPALSDGLGCTTDACSEATDTITHTPSDVACSNGLFCDGTETCSATLGCRSGTPPALSDSVGCTTDACVEATDSITHTPNDGACSNGLFCDGTETCSAVNGCQSGTPPALSDGLACTTDACVEATDSITHTPNDGACSDGLYCNGAESCDVGLGCVLGTPPSGSDGVPCTTDTCVEASDSFTHTPSNAACNNGLYCDGTETCSAVNGCQSGTPPVLSDGVPCTTDSCDEGADSVVHTPNDGACSDGLFCTGTETCSATQGCQAGSDPCPSLICSEALDACTGCTGVADCDDQDPCTIDTCNSGTCGHAASPQYYADSDGDTFGGAFLGCVNPGGAVTVGGDCNDGNAAIKPSAAESCNGVDDDCDGVPDDGLVIPYYYDNDGDSYGSTYYGHYCSSPGAGTSAMPGDCDDGSSSVHPGATETCNASDDDCDGVADDGVTYTAYYYDSDGDGYGSSYWGSACSNPGGGYSSTQGDCNDGANTTHPNATELCDLVDNDCDGTADDGLTYTPYFYDSDGDGYGASYWGSACSDPGAGYSSTQGDCNDGANTTHPNATELCDLVDNDCDGTADDGLTYTPYFFDSDGDGYGASYWGSSCSDPGSGYSSTEGDCNDGTNTTHPNATELCDSADNDCNGTVDDGVEYVTYYYDSDGDSYGSYYFGSYCEPPGSGYSANGGDCNDGASETHPGAAETCDSQDNDCDGLADGGLPFTDYYYDGDGDGCGSGNYWGATCGTQPSGTAANASDCDDGDPESSCGCTPETCTAVDYYYDSDGDGYGGAFYARACSAPGGSTTSNPGDCNDGAANAYPSAPELCDGYDNNCDGVADDGLTFTTYYYDSDGDSYGGAYYGSACSAPGGSTTSNPGDCNDGSAAQRPGHAEVCDGVDNDCDGQADDGLTFTTYYYDSDGDDYGGQFYSRACSAPGGSTTSTTGDCNDASASQHPLLAEACDSIDNDCDGLVDDGLTFNKYYYDSDGDGYGGQFFSRACSAPGGSTTSTTGDCNDGSASQHPLLAEACDSIDNDCDGLVDDGLTFNKYYYDSDGDGYGGQFYSRDCSAPGGSTTSTTGDCNDGSAAIKPSATEVCNGYDDDCDGVAEDGLVFVPYFYDSDADNYGAAYYAHACSDPGGSTASVWGDCNDGANTTHPGATELCDDVDNDCDGPKDEGCP